MKKIIIIAALLISILGFSQNEKTLHSFTVNDISGNKYELSQLEGKKVLVVNTASKCGLTPQYEDLEKLYQTYKDQNFVIIGFPANNFMNQEPGSNEEIAEFCQVNYGVTFPMMEKISVKGDDIHPIYEWLTSSTLSDVKWNFQKFMINPDGTIAGWSKPRTKPFDKDITDWIEGN
ncbi:MAG: glutathione peroxidase [Prolixibacteraceae bacterium]|jgi:glutathione peroxidase|nr:glutathione peroxidase [Prolixibacteraceae bacterium]